MRNRRSEPVRTWTRRTAKLPQRVYGSGTRVELGPGPVPKGQVQMVQVPQRGELVTVSGDSAPAIVPSAPGAVGSR